MKPQRIILITGLSGSGKTTAIKALEDAGFYCVDNLPPPLLSKFLELCKESAEKISKVAIVQDIRSALGHLPPGQTEEDFFEASRRMIEELRREGFPIEVLFLDASDPVLTRRFSETRRQHPLALGGCILDGIRLERERLRGLRDIANEVIDTSQFNVHELKAKVQQYAQKDPQAVPLTLTLLSFGYSFGVPYEADLMFDVRFLPNPYYVEELKRFPGDHPKVEAYVLQWEETRDFLNRAMDFLRFLLPFYFRERRTHLTVAVGCTGGRHRSIVIVNQLAERLKRERDVKGMLIAVRHRDIERG
ncbi:MAG: RNase adapter RapZ [Desulfobacterota bacterium]|nr:RNase adapter RapZ [Thermodesulfobacteriota bacterium]